MPAAVRVRRPRLPRLPRLWRRSLLARVVTATLLLSSLVVLAVGAVLVHQVGRGLLDAQRAQALADLDAGLPYARTTLTATPTNGITQDDLAARVVTTLQGGGRRGDTDQYDVLLLPSGTDASAFSQRGAVGPEAVPAALRERVRAQREAYAYVALPRGGGRVLLVGAPVVAGQAGYELYYAFPLVQQEQSLALVRSRLLTGGAALVVLLALVAALVARQVVTPVRLAARVAGRLAAGRLTERLEVRGSDDLARLATSFNAMAAGLQRQIGQLEELSRVQRRFVADVSHELRTPLTTVRMAADLLHSSRAAFPPEVARAAELLQDQLDRFEGLLTDLLEISRYDANAAELEWETADVGQLVDEAVALVGPLAADRGVPLRVERRVPGDGPVLAEVDPRRVARVLRNLLANAVDHGEGEPVVVALAADDDAVAVRVRDHGVGLRPGEAERVFDRFWRADPSRARTSGGTGLGLSIAREDARLHGGELAAWGRPGAGASFRLLLPRHVGGDPVGAADDLLPLVPEDAGPGVPAPAVPAAAQRVRAALLDDPAGVPR